MRGVFVLVLGLLGWPALAPAHEAKDEQHEERLPTIGAAPDFALISQDGAEVTLAALRGKIVAVTFIYASCPDVCPMLTDKLARVQDALGRISAARSGSSRSRPIRSGIRPRC
jgi:protein SCO1